MTLKRDWRAARAKVDAAGQCRVCHTSRNIEAAHIVPRSRITVGGEDPRNIVPLCGNQGCACHRSFDEGTLDLLPYLTLEEQAYAVSLVGLAEAYRRVTGSRELAA